MRPGSHLSIELINTPQSHYFGPLELDAGDEEFRERVEAVGGEATYDPWLARAAREMAFQGALLSESPPEPALSFILRSSGAPEGSVAQLLVQASGEESKILDDAIRSALESAPSGPGSLLIGVGEAATEEAEYDRRVVVAVARRDFSLEPTPRSVGLGTAWRIRGQAPRGFGDAHASVLYPDNRIEEIPVAIESGRFDFEVPSGNEMGTIRVSIDGKGPEGPGKLLQLQAEVGREVPREFEMLLPPAENFDEVPAAERYAFELLNRDRQDLGLPTLVLDAALSDVARAHSEDMRDHGFFAHLSPRTGLAADRLEAAGYQASGHGENLAFNDSIAEAESSLLESVGHRRNIVSREVTHVGIGLAHSLGEGKRSSWHLTQLFAKPVRALDPERAREQMFERINKARRAAGDEELSMSPELSALALDGAEEALATEIKSVPSLVAPRASALAKTLVAVSVHVFYELDSLEPDESSLGSDFERLGLAFVRDPESLQGRTIMVLIVAE